MGWMAMDRRHIRGFNAAAKEELWDRWQRGESLKAIGRAFGKPSSSIYFQVPPHGGIRPVPRRRSRLALTLAEREEISRGVASARSMRSMARLLGHSPSTVSREIKRNGGYDRYRAAVADENAWVRARRPKRCKLANNPRLRRTVVGKLRSNWSPQMTSTARPQRDTVTSTAHCLTQCSTASSTRWRAGSPPSTDVRSRPQRSLSIRSPCQAPIISSTASTFRETLAGSARHLS